MEEERSGWSVVGTVFKVLGKIFGTILLVAVITGLILLCRFAKYVKEDLSQQTALDLNNFTLDQTSVIYYTDPDTGRERELVRLYGSENRTVVSYDKLPKDLINACVAIEDKRFYDHRGVDWLRTARASLNMFLGGRSTFGASTLTQQLIKNLTGRDEVTVRRKLSEIFSALEFEKHHSKTEILTWYLNTIYLGEGCYGVQSAARVYFGKDVEDLTTAECASLIGITKNPSVYDPYINEDKNLERQKDILWAMYDQGLIPTEAAYRRAKEQELVFSNTSGQEDEDTVYYSYFIDQVLRDVTDALVEKGVARQLAEQMVRSGGLAIHSTYNPAIQAKVDAVYQDLDGVPKTKSSQQLQSGIAVVDNRSGDMVALAGGVGEKTGSLTFNRATQAYLQPGSIIKPLTVYGPALELGLITPVSVYDDTPYSFTETGRWPKNSDDTYHGLINIDRAMQLSTNTVAVKVLAELGLEASFRFGRDKMGLRHLEEQKLVNGEVLSDITPWALALGGTCGGVTVAEAAAGYAAIVNQGVYREPRTYTRVSRVINGTEETILDNRQSSQQALSEKSAWYLTYMMQNTVRSGTGAPAQLENMAVAGKTGTTSSDKDRWFCGFTPYYTAAVWCGYDLPEEIILTPDNVSQENPACQLWQRVMAGVHEGLAYQEFRRPADIIECTFCCDSGLLATEACRADPRGDRTVRGYLALSDAPKEHCTTHRLVELCGISGQLANEFCGQIRGNHMQKIGLLDLERVYPQSGVIVEDQEYVIERPGRLPGGYYNAVSPNGERRGESCALHSKYSMEPEEEEETPPAGEELEFPELPETPEAPEMPELPETPEEPARPEEPPVEEQPTDELPEVEPVPDLPVNPFDPQPGGEEPGAPMEPEGDANVSE